MPSETEEKQVSQAAHTLTEFVRIFAKEYPLVFKDGSGCIKIHPSPPSFPYEVTLEIRKKEQIQSTKKNGP